MESVMNIIRSVRNQRAEMNVPPSRKASLIVRTDKEEVISSCEAYLIKLAYASDVTIIAPGDAEPKNAAGCVTDIGEVYMPLGDLIDVEKETARLEKELANLEGEIKRANGKLSNERFISKAPAAVVEEEKKKLEKYTDMLEKVRVRIASLKEI